MIFYNYFLTTMYLTFLHSNKISQGQGPDVGLCVQGGPNPGPHIEGGHGVLYNPSKLSVYVICRDSQGTTRVRSVNSSSI